MSCRSFTRPIPLAAVLVSLSCLNPSIVPGAFAQFCDAGGQASVIQQAVTAEMVVIGKVVELESEQKMIENIPGAGKTAHTIAGVRIQETLLGRPGLTNVRVAYTTSQPNTSRFRRARTAVTSRPLSPGEEACFFLRRIAADDCYVLHNGAPLDKCDIGYQNHIGCVRKIAAAIAKPVVCLRSNDAGDRQLAACVVLIRRGAGQAGFGPDARGPFPVDESPRILQALSEMKWDETPFDPEGTLSLPAAFASLQLTDKDGWKQPQGKEDDDVSFITGNAALAWLRGNAGKYRIRPALADAKKAD